MEKKSKEVLRKHKKARPASSSDSSSSSDSESGSSSGSYSSSSSDKKAMHRKGKKARVRRSSSSSDNDRARKREKHACHRKLEAKKNHLKRKLKEAKAKKQRVISSPSMRRRSGTPIKQKKIIPPVGSSAEKKHHQLILKERMLKEKEREREREKIRLGRERNPNHTGVKKPKSRSSSKIIRCRNEMKRKSPMGGAERHHQISPREKIIIQARRDRSPNERIKGPKDIRHRLDDRRDRERAEAARQKEREEALARCQERQRERERIAREKMMRRDKEYDRDRLLPRPAEREMAIAAARAANSRERSIEQQDIRRTGHIHGGHNSRQPRSDINYERTGGTYDRDREFTAHNDGHRSLERDDRRGGGGGGGSNVSEIDREYLVMRRRDVSSPTGNSGHYSDRQRGSDREVYPDDERYDRDNYPPQRVHSRNYIQSNDDGTQQHHRRGGDRNNGPGGGNWDQQNHRDHEDRGKEHHDKHFQEKLMNRSGDWKSNKNEWSDTPHWEEKNWQQRKKPLPLIPNEENWDGDERYSGPIMPPKKGDWNDPVGGSISGRGKHDHGRDDHTSNISGSNQHEGSHQHTNTGRRWQQQEWRGRAPNDSRQIHGSGPGQSSGQTNFRKMDKRHNSQLHQHPMDYNHERPDYRRQQHSHHSTHMQHHHSSGYHHQPRPHFPSKRQMTYTNPNLLKAQQILPTNGCNVVVNTAIAVTAPNGITPPISTSSACGTPNSNNATSIEGLVKETITPIIEVSPKPAEVQDKVIVATTIAVTNATTTTTDIIIPIDKNPEIINEIASPAVSEPAATTVDDTETNVTDVMLDETNTAISNQADESIPDDLSEISDEADEILNKDEDQFIRKNFGNDLDANDMVIPEDAQSQENTKDELLVNSEGGDTQGDPIDKDLNDDLLDFEEISDGELEEESRKNLGDALGVDWASLVRDTKVHGRVPSEEQHTTAKQKWQPHRIILDVGISFKYAGEEFAKRILNDAKLKLEAEQAQMKTSADGDNDNDDADDEDDEESTGEDKINSTDVKIKMEKEDIDDFQISANNNKSSSTITDMKKQDSLIKDCLNFLDSDKLSGIACVQVAARRTKEIRRNLIFHACGPNSRALSARRDLNLRRQLVGLPITKIVRPRPVSDRMKALALKAFQDAVATAAN